MDNIQKKRAILECCIQNERDERRGEKKKGKKNGEKRIFRSV